MLERAEAALAPGGTLLVVGHNRLNLTEGHGGPPNPEVFFSAAHIERELPGLLIERLSGGAPEIGGATRP